MCAAHIHFTCSYLLYSHRVGSRGCKRSMTAHSCTCYIRLVFFPAILCAQPQCRRRHKEGWFHSALIGSRWDRMAHLACVVREEKIRGSGMPGTKDFRLPGSWAPTKSQPAGGRPLRRSCRFLELSSGRAPVLGSRVGRLPPLPLWRCLISPHQGWVLRGGRRRRIPPRRVGTSCDGLARGKSPSRKAYDSAAFAQCT